MNSAIWGDRYLTEPDWTRVVFIWRFFFPEVIEFCNRLGSSTRPRKTSQGDAEAVSNSLYPVETQSHEFKAD